MMGNFRALVLKQEDKKTLSSVEMLPRNQLPEGDTLIKVEYSTINYKDALAITGKGKIVRSFPFVPGIDLLGKVVEGGDDRIKVGMSVIHTGWGVGEKHFGGLAGYARLKAKWLVETPATLTGDRAMVAGTAGLTGALCVQRLIDAGVRPDNGPVVVTGASGGVGSFAVNILANIGYTVHAVSRPESTDYLKSLGAKEIIDRAEFGLESRPLEQGKWAGGIDTVGSKTLARILAESEYNATISCCGLAGGFDLPSTVMPFILRNVTLAGVDSVYISITQRNAAWKLIAEYVDEATFNTIRTATLTLEEVGSYCHEMLKGKHQGRVVVKP